MEATSEDGAQSVPAGKPDRDEERRLVERATARDQGAFAQLYDQHVVRVYRHIYYMVSDAREAEDLTAQTFLKAWEAIDRYKERGAPFVAWLLRISHNLTISYLRSRRDHSELDEGFVDSKRGGNPEESLEQATDERSVREAVLRLRDEQRQVIMLRFVEELDYREVAAMIGKSVPAVRVIQHRALGNLRKLMQQ
ncbi:MAG TPA: sigma-70 family RNA polymerase sigma factor [Dehalococcoidia bacterium]|nr:sigma-70 family RNA polymerase sigma factor [Dehalococcoidia bacterium]